MASIVEQGKSVHARIRPQRLSCSNENIPYKNPRESMGSVALNIKWTAERGSIDVLDLHHSAMRGISIIE